MIHTRLRLAALVVPCLLLAVFAQNQNAPQTPAAPAVPVELKVPEGFTASVFATGLVQPRLIAFSPDGVLYAARQSKGDVVALPDADKDGKADKMEIVASNLVRPHGLAFHKGWLYIATNPTVVKMKYANGKLEGAPVKVVDLPVSTTSHWTRTIGFGRDGKMYVSIGSSCNLCEDEDARRTTIMQYNIDGSGGRAFAKGLRNAIGFGWDPKSALMYSTDMGEDGLGEQVPPDEINLIQDGKHYGWPYFVGKNMANPNLKNPKGALKAEEATPPAFELPAHASPIDLAFYTGKKFPAAYRGAMFVTLHGSGPKSRPDKVGYKVVRVVMQDGKPVGIEDFATGWLKDGQVIGRPAALATGPDGALYVSDDTKGFIYRIAYGK